MKKLYLPTILITLLACNKEQPKRFELLSPEATGIHFSNELEETPAFNIFSYLYFYNGAGVSTGDLNGDGLADLYFTANQHSNKLYLNQGNFKFKDITEATGTEGQKGWTTGVTMADVNGDGKLDIYVSQLGDFQNIRGKNQLYINLGNDSEGIPQFEDQAEKYGLALIGFSTQAAFFDYDLDGDLDMYMLNHSLHSQGTFGKSDKRKENNPLSGDKLMRNDGEIFTDVTETSGIYSSVLGYGLGISTGDVNWDGFPDIYIGNDFHENDYLYINNGDGTFSEQLEQQMMHTSRFSMGNDINDINNDGLPDILALDMLPEDPVMLKAAAAEDPYDIYHFKLNYGYGHQFARNTLQLNQGNEKFSEIGLLTGIYATDWSWSGLITDLDLDGRKDILIANGIKRRSNDMDYISFASNEAIQYRLEGDITDQDLKIIEQMPVVKIPNYVFQNKGALAFENVSASWGLDHNSFSNGAAYADLDNDGDLDLVINNIDAKAFIYKNKTIDKDKIENNFLKIKLKGKGKNTVGIGTKIVIPQGNETITHELFTTRGYQSSVEPIFTIGLGKNQQVDSLYIIWSDQSFQLSTNLKANQTVVFDQKEALGKYDFTKAKQQPLFEDISDSLSINYKHRENRFVEFTREPLLPHMNSTEGPKIAVGDVNADGLDDFFVGGAKRQPGSLFLQTSTGFEWVLTPAFKMDSTNEDTDAVFIDVDTDGDLDLVVASGGNEFKKTDTPLLPRLYLNDGAGGFTKDTVRLPKIFLTASCIAPTDFDQDGDIDLFIGGRAVPWQFGQIPNSYLLLNDGKGYFKDVTDKFDGLREIGFVKDAKWHDMNADGAEDLIVAGEWIPVTIFFNKKITFEKHTLKNSNGWWNTVNVTDLNNDGTPDLLVGNLGLNSKLKASKKQPLRMYVDDFDKNGSLDQLLCYFDKDGKERLFPTRDEVTTQLVHIKKKFVKYTDFANAELYDIVPKNDLNAAKTFEVFELRSGAFLNQNNGDYAFQPFPQAAQFAPINAIHTDDFNQDGFQDVLAVGNFYEVNIQRGRYDASFGHLLVNDAGKGFWQLSNRKSGLLVEGQSRDIAALNTDNQQKIIIIAKNNEQLQLLKTTVSKGEL